MPQETNFNVSPYFDDFDRNNNYYRVLFKPGYPVQARELTTAQSILQNQIEQFGSKFFREGQIVVPGSLIYDNPTYAVEIDPSYNGLPISLYFSSLIGKKIKGLSSGVTAEIFALLDESVSERGNNTLYVKYLESGGEDLTIKRFQDGETLIAIDPITYGKNNKFSIQINQGICNTISSNSISEGSVISISEGVCFTRGLFVNFDKQTLILDQYGVEPSYKIGFDIVERIVTSDEDESLYDNARNFSNFTAPGADRLKVELFLAKKDLESIENDSFIELMKVVDGIPLFSDSTSDKSDVINTAKTETSRAISDISGDFFVKSFDVYVRDSLNDGLLNNGIFFEDQSTVAGNTPTEDKIVYQIGPGKAYINGFVVETTSARILDASKPRSSDTCTKEVVSYNAGTLYVLNNTYGSANIGLSTDAVVSLMNERIGDDAHIAAGTTIGLARVYDYVPESEYEDDLSRMHLRLFDTQTFTELEFAKPVVVERPSYFKGKKTGASAYAYDTFSEVTDIQNIVYSDSVGISTILFEFDKLGTGSVGVATIGLGDNTPIESGINNGDFIYIDGTGIQELDFSTAGRFQVSNIGVTTSGDFEISLQSYPNITGATLNSPFQNGYQIEDLGSVVNVSVAATINSTSHGLTPGQKIVIRETSNNKFNRSWVVDQVFDANTFSLVGVTAENYFEGFVSSIGGEHLTLLDKVTLYEVSGQFAKGEQIKINGIDDGRLITDIVDYDLNDVKSIFSDKIGISTFNGDVVLERTSSLAPPGTLFEITPAIDPAGNPIGVSTIFVTSQTKITSNLKVGDIISWPDESKPLNSDGSFSPTFNRVISINPNGKEFQVGAVSTVTNYVNGGLYDGGGGGFSNNSQRTNVNKVSNAVYGSPDDESLLVGFNNTVLSSVDLENNEILQRRLFKNIGYSQNTLEITIDPAEDSIFFASFDEDRYVITYEDGRIETIRFDRFNISGDGKTATFVDLRQCNPSGSGFADVIATVNNLKPNSKIKNFNAASVLTVNRSKLKSSGAGEGTLNDGLTYSNVYGTRVQDEIISLNVPDCIRVIGVFESSNTLEASLPNVQLIGSTNTNFLEGEHIKGSTSGAIAVLVKKKNSDILEYVYLNSKTFEINETITGKESLASATINFVAIGDKNITQNYSFDDGQRSQFYDYSRIVRARNVEPPKGKLKIVFQNYEVKSTDDGEYFTVNSYPNRNYKHDVLSYDGKRLTDYVDIRPRVNKYNLSSQKSPFEFGQRNFSGQGQSSTYTLAPGENLNVCYKYYVGRIDKVILNPNGEFSILEGNPSVNPKEPTEPDGCLVIATVNIPPYLFNVSSIEVDVESHRTYSMRDIASLEDRIKRLEEFVVLNTLEVKTENLKLTDAETGLDRLKCGFFVDTFTNTNLHDEEDPDYKIAIDDETNVLRPTHYTTAIDMQLGSEVIAGVGATFEQFKDHDFVTDLGSQGVRKTGDLITLNYGDVEYFQQPYATRTESVTPFLVKYWTGSIDLRPPSDSWIEEREEINRSFNTEVETLPRLPDINIVRVNNVTRTRRVFRNRVVVQRGIWNRRWITSRGTWWRRGRWVGTRRRNWANSKLWRRRTRGLSSSIRNVNGRQVVQFRAVRGRLSDADASWLRRVLPRDVADGFITQIRTRSSNRAVFLQFAPGVGRDVLRTTTSTSTTVRTSSNTVTTTIPPEINVSETVSETSSNFTEPVRFLRSRNIEFDVKGLRPRTRFYPFFEGIDVKNYIIPKLLEVEMIQGRFEIGETVESDPQFTSKKIRFRLCRPDHKTGPFANPEETFTTIPYKQAEPPENYTESSDYLNVDTRSLQLNSEVDFYGEVALNMKIIGKTSGAVARINSIRLVSDNGGRLIGSLFIPDPKIQGNPSWTNGENTFTVIDTPSLSEAASGDDNVVSESSAEEEFTSSATTNVTIRNILTTRNIRIRPARNINTTTVTNVRTNTTATTTTRIRRRAGRIVRRWEVRDPLAQSFFVKDETGIFLTGVDVYFETKDESGIPVTLQLRTMENGIPTTTVFPFSEVTLVPDEINLSIDGTVPTRFTFPSPVYLSGPQGQQVRGAPIGSEATAEYAVVLLSNSSNYRVFISRLGENDIITNIRVGAQPTLGSLFKSQNGSTWTPSQLEDLKYKLYRADFVDQGVVRYYNPILALKNEKVTVLGPNQITTLDQRAIIKLTEGSDIKSEVTPGSTIIQKDNAQGKLVSIGGSISPGLGVTISNVGFGYTNGTFTNGGTGFELITLTGNGSGAKANITVTNGTISDVSIVTGGFGYVEGDVLRLPSIGQNVGFGGQVIVDSLSLKNTLIIDNVVKGPNAGDSASFFNNQIMFFVNAGIQTYVGFSSFTSLPSKSELVVFDNVNDGLHFKIDAVNHGMHSSQNYVRISNVRPEEDEPNTVLTSSVTNTETSIINVENTSGFETFEGLPVSGDNPGYIIIGDEVVGYTTFTSTSLGAGTPTITRGVIGESQSYDVGTPVYRYEFNGVSLRRINKIHSLSTVDQDVHPTKLNSFYVQIEVGNNDFEGNEIGKNRPDNLVFNKNASLGDAGAIVSTNINFDILTPNFATIKPPQTSIKSQVRTYSGTSIDGNETSFVDQGYEEMSLEEPTVFSNPRIIGSRVNEFRNIEDSPGNRSLTMEFNLETEDSRVSPVIDDVTTGAILTSNLINAPAGIGNDSRFADVEYIRGGDQDEHEAIYISKPISLKLPANSIKVFLNAARTENNDLRVLYKLIREDGSESDSNFEPFPGYANYKTGSSGLLEVIDPSKNDGSSDVNISINSNTDYQEYEYTIDNLPEFTQFAIKIIFASKNQSEPPIVKALRAIATLKPSLQ